MEPGNSTIKELTSEEREGLVEKDIESMTLEELKSCYLANTLNWYNAVDELLDLREKNLELTAEIASYDDVRGRMSAILHNTANALHGGPRLGGLWTWHNLAELVAKQRTDLLLAQSKIKEQEKEIETLRKLANNSVK